MMQVSLSVTGLQVKTPALEAATVLLSGPIEFELKSGEINVIRGGNGVGKSTLLRLMSNALPGQGILFKPEFGLRDELLVDTHLQIVMDHLGADSNQIEQLLEQVGLSNWQYERIGTLSSGQRARLGLCTLLAGQFKVWLLDEPLNALDHDGVATLAKARACIKGPISVPRPSATAVIRSSTSASIVAGARAAISAGVSGEGSPHL
mgnify:CR=1 FL=1